MMIKQTGTLTDCTTSKPCRGFTMIELLVVITLIAILLAILLPTLSRARQAAQLVVCQSNERQMYLGIVGYSLDNRDRLPWLYEYPGDNYYGGSSMVMSSWYFLTAPYLMDSGSYNTTYRAPFVWADANAKRIVWNRAPFICPTRHVALPTIQTGDFPGGRWFWTNYGVCWQYSAPPLITINSVWVTKYELDAGGTGAGVVKWQSKEGNRYPMLCETWQPATMNGGASVWTSDTKAAGFYDIPLHLDKNVKLLADGSVVAKKVTATTRYSFITTPD